MLLPSPLYLGCLLLFFIINAWLVFLIYRYNGNSVVSRTFIITSIILAVWQVPIYLSLIPEDYGYRLVFARAAMSIGVIINLSIYLLTYTLINKKLPKNVVFIPAIVFTAILFFLSFSSYIFKAVVFTNSYIETIPGPAISLVTIHTLLFVLGAVYLLIVNIRRSEGVLYKRLILVLSGIVGMFTGILFTIFLPIVFFNNATFVQFAPLYTIIFLIFSAIAILKYQLFDIKLIAIETMAVLLVSFLFIQIFLSSAPDVAVINTLVFLIALVVSWWLIKTNRRELIRREEDIKVVALESSNKQLQELDKQKTEFLTIAAHQLRTPVSIINNYVSMLQDGDYGLVPDPAKQVLSNIDQSNQWLVRLANEFLNIANLEQGQTKYHFIKNDVRSIVESVIAELIPKAKLGHARLEWVKPLDVLLVECDEEKLRAVIFNFLDNAIKYGVPENIQASDGSLSPITITATRDQEGIKLTVKDQGLGFGPDDKVKFFQKFSRGNNARSIHVNLSTGLGLYICRKFVEGHQGNIWAHSDGLGKGSEFGFWIPLRQDKNF